MQVIDQLSPLLLGIIIGFCVMKFYTLCYDITKASKSSPEVESMAMDLTDKFVGSSIIQSSNVVEKNKNQSY